MRRSVVVEGISFNYYPVRRGAAVYYSTCQDDVGGNVSCLTYLLGYGTLRVGNISLEIALASAGQRHSTGLLPRPPFCVSGLFENKGTSNNVLSAGIKGF